MTQSGTSTTLYNQLILVIFDIINIDIFTLDTYTCTVYVHRAIYVNITKLYLFDLLIRNLISTKKKTFYFT